MNEEVLSVQVIRLSPQGDCRNDSEAWCLLVATEGAGKLRWDSTTQALRPGDVFLVPPQAPVSLTADSGGSLAAGCFKFFPDRLTGLLSLDELLLFQRAATQGQCLRITSPGRQLGDRLTFLTHQPSSSVTIDHRCQLLSLIDPVVLVLRQALKENPTVSPAGRRVLRVLEQMSAADLQALSVTGMADRCGCSRRHLNRLIHEEFGCSIISLKTRIRLDRAAALLGNPGIKVIDVAQQCGFSHLGSFTARFKERFGSTPARWRRQRRAETLPKPAPKPGPLLPRWRVPWRQGTEQDRLYASV